MYRCMAEGQVKRTASFGVWLRCPWTGLGTSTLVVRLSTDEEELLLEPNLADVCPLTPHEHVDSEIFKKLTFHSKGFTVPSVHNPGICDTDINGICKHACMYHLLDFIVLR